MSFSYQGLVPNPKDDLTNLIQLPTSHILPASALWRLQHSSLTLIGGVAFTLGSYQYLPWKDGQGGSLFVLGSVALFCADLMNWWSNRVGCACDARYRGDLEDKLGMDLDHADSPQGQFQRAEAGLNYFLTLCGSLLYVVGCVLFDTREVAVGDVIFIPGSVVLMLSGGGKCAVWGARVTDGEPCLTSQTLLISAYAWGQMAASGWELRASWQAACSSYPAWTAQTSTSCAPRSYSSVAAACSRSAV
eukprot:CAMPEP_0173196092 /NCGR_PEP_ID=MMETSP1141-20130122/15422_1 /TAXON_ID=483371 /ORGANISM="non described non described, Strain CCMP2298" /LENGTH=246 /DNA_ID=CAMNT_0014120701 /DNA_START=414 /DNA_END=1155 /DNA_ORIENTATION=-